MPLDTKQNLFLIIGGLFHDSRQYLDNLMKAFNLTRPEWLILAMLRLNPEGVSQNFAKAYVGIENSYFTKILNRLEEKQLIVRDIDINDRRNRIIKINPKAPKLLNNVFKIISNFTTTIQKDLSDRQIQNLYKGLSSIQDNLNTIKKGDV